MYIKADIQQIDGGDLYPLLLVHHFEEQENPRTQGAMGGRG
jgi:hypothetical protein